jgi:hypothetical protein
MIEPGRAIRLPVNLVAIGMHDETTIARRLPSAGLRR